MQSCTDKPELGHMTNYSRCVTLHFAIRSRYHLLPFITPPTHPLLYHLLSAATVPSTISLGVDLHCPSCPVNEGAGSSGGAWDMLPEDVRQLVLGQVRLDASNTSREYFGTGTDRKKQNVSDGWLTTADTVFDGWPNLGWHRLLLFQMSGSTWAFICGPHLAEE